METVAPSFPHPAAITPPMQLARLRRRGGEEQSRLRGFLGLRTRGIRRKNIGTTAENIHDLPGPTSTFCIFVKGEGVFILELWQLALISSIAPCSRTAAGCRIIGSTANSTACRRQYPAPAAGRSAAIISRPDQARNLDGDQFNGVHRRQQTGRRDQVAPCGSESNS